MKESMSHAFGVIGMSLDLPLGLWPVTIALSLLAAWSAYQLFLSNRIRSWPTLTLIVGSVVVFLGIPLYAVAFWADPSVDTPATQELPTNVLGILMLGYFGLVALSIALARGYRALLAGVAALLVWMNCGVLLVAVMAVSGVWL